MAIRIPASEIDAARATFEALLQNCGAAVWALDHEDRVIEANVTARRYLRGGPAKRSKPVGEATDWPELAELVAKVRRAGRAQSAEMDSAPGAERILAVEAHPVAGPDGRILIIAQDITALRRLERVRRDFVANVSHELRTPLASIRAMAETLQGGALNDPEVAQRFMGTIVNETDRLARIAEDLLILSDAESRSPERAPCDLSALVEEVVRRFESQAQRHELRLTATVEPNLTIMAARDQLEQAVVNLVDNAIKYTPVGGSVYVSAKGRGGEVSVAVQDTGIGIPEEHLPRLFERFYRVDKARSRQSGGTGLGLSIVKNIVEGHGGRVEVESVPGRGTVFTIRMPVKA